MVTDKVYDTDRLGTSHRFCLEHVPPESRVLEFGPATGYMTRVLRDDLKCRVTGFEYSQEAASQSSQFCEQMVVGDIENFEIWSALTGPYDVIIFADVLEHLRVPNVVLKRCYGLLASTGRIIISIPNIAHWTVRAALARGKFDYTETGLLDNTHVKFFTKKTLTNMIADCGFVVKSLNFTTSHYPADRLFAKMRLWRLKSRINSLINRVAPNAAAFQFIVCCERKTQE